MARVKTYVNTALFQVQKGTTGTVQPFAPVNVNKYRKLRNAEAPTRAKLRIDRLYICAEPGQDKGLVAKALKGAVLSLVGQTGNRIELGPASLWCIDLMPYTSDESFNLPVPVVIPQGAPYDVVVEYQEPSGLADNEKCDLFVKLEGVEIEEEER